MTYQTTIEKDRNGWNAITAVEIGETPEGKRVLELSTSKRRNKIISSNVAVFIYQYDSDGHFTSKSTILFQDFSKSNIAPMPCTRVTEATIKKAHDFALLEINTITQEAKAFYAEQDKQTA